jgi:TolA-binding protein
MNCRKEKITVGYAYTTDDIKMLESEYELYIKENDNPVISSDLTMDLADLETFFLNNLSKATTLLQQLVETPGLNKVTQANAKLKLGDLYLMQGERWESTLLYSQVDKDFKDDTLGHEARYRNARLSYFNADFEWAKSQFGVLKASTSKLISNDAIDLNVFIVDNTGLDTSEAAMTIYAEAELLVFQNKFQEAFAKLDTLVQKFPKHSLQDDVLWLEAQIHIKKRDYLKAVPLLEKIIADHKEEIRADNALYTLAGLYANPLQLNDKDKAKSLYEKLFTEFSNSTFAIDARKYYRILRGDKVQ